ncbi:MAG TPA: type II CAAX endopeptidase family protein [Allosphingosinicella sp.]|nr:type II CAAX endopeptidase family protein [Allosphingosinicella sp.]
MPAVEPGPVDDPFAAALRGFGPVGLLAILAILAGNALVVPMSAVLVLLWAHRSRTPWRAIGLARPGSWFSALALGVLFGIAFKLAMKALVMPLLGADPVNQAYHHLAGNTAALPVMLYLILIGAGFGEEVVWRGWMFERLGRVLGGGAAAKAATILVTALLFGLAHYPEQGLPGVEQAAIVGLVFGAIFAITGRLWPLVFAHAAFDLTALGLIYWDVETKVARALLG